MGNEAHVRRENIIAKPALSVLEKGGSEHFVEGLRLKGARMRTRATIEIQKSLTEYLTIPEI